MTYRFGAFEVAPDAHELRKSGIRVKIQDQLFVVLLKLVQRPGDLVTREELRLALWPDGTFVDFDAGLNTVIKRLREVLGDSAEVPRFIETVPKLGYRFLATVEGLDRFGLASERPPRRGRLSIIVRVAVAGSLIAIFAVAYVFYWRPHLLRSNSTEVVPMTGMPGGENDPAFSPDGKQVAFTLSEDGGANRSGIYTTLVGGERPLQLTNDRRDCCAVWSPDGASVGFVRSDEAAVGLYTVPALGGNPRRIYSVEKSHESNIGKALNFSWSADARYLLLSIPQRSTPPAQKRSSIALVLVEDSSAHFITSPPPGSSDWSPSFSPDGKSIAFVRSAGAGMVDDLYVVPTSGGEQRRLTYDRCYLRGKPVWSSDGREIIFASPRRGLDSLWRIPASGGTPLRLEGVGTSVLEPAVSPRAGRLAYVNISAQINLWTIPLKDARHAAQAPHVLFVTKGQAGLAYISPKNGRITFESTQSGYHEIWAVDDAGSNPSQITFLHGISGSPRWSFDGRLIAFDYRPVERSEVYLVEATGAPHIFPTIPGADNTEPSFSRDGKWLYFSSNPGSAVTQVWKMPFPYGGPPIQLTKNGGVKPIESADGFVYFARTFYGDEIWKVSPNGGEETLVMKGAGLEDSWNWSLSPFGIYFMNGHGKRTLFFYEFATQKTFPIFTMGKTAFHPAVTSDGKSVVFSQVDQEDQSIMIVNHFR